MPAGGPRRRGFHQLAEPYARRLVASAGVGRGDLVLDVGAGTGVLTALLAATGAHVVAIELHPDRLAALRERFDVDSTRHRERFDVESTPRGRGSVRVVKADATDLRLPRRPFVVVANPPWTTTTALLRRLTQPGSRLVHAHLVVPRHSAERWAAPTAPGAGRWQRAFDVRIGPALPRDAFRPPPPQAATLLTLRRRGPA